MKGTRLTDVLYNEITLLWYSLRMLVGRNLLAVGFISLVVLGAIFSEQASIRQTRLAILLKQLELFAPLLGIVIFSDLIAGDVQAKRATLLQCSRAGIVPVVIRKLVHGLLITSVTYLLLLLILRVGFTSFDLLPTFAIVVPGALYFGMIGLLGATVTSQALAGYAVGTGALILSMVIKEAMPLVPVAYQMRSKLATATLFTSHNWIFAKIVFVVLAALLALLVIAMAKKRTRSIPITVTAVLGLVLCHGVIHAQWARKVPPDVHFAGPGKQVAVIQNGDELTVRTAAVCLWGRGKHKTNEETKLTDTHYRSDNGQWIQQQQAEYDPSRELDLLHLEIDAKLVPDTAAIDAHVRADIAVLADTVNKLYLHLAYELQVKDVQVNGARAAFSRYGDVVEVPLSEPATQGQTVKVDLTYGGNLIVPGGRHGIERSTKDIFFVNSRWYPFVKSWWHPGQLELCTYDARITVPQAWQVAAGQRISTEGIHHTWQMGTDTPGDRIALAIHRFRQVQMQYGDIEVTVSGHSMSDAYMRDIAARATDALDTYVSAFGPYPHRHLAIVEYDYIGAGGVAVPSIVLLNPRRCRPELTWDMLNMYIPHEVAHQWFSCALPTWMAEGSAVYSNYLYLARRAEPADCIRFLKDLHDTFQTDKDYPFTLIGSTGVTAYIKGGYFMTMLTSVNTPGTVNALGAFIQDQFKQQLVDLNQINDAFIAAMQQAGGPDLGTFASDWARSTDKFDPAVTAFRQSQADTRYRVTASLTHQERIRFPVPVRIDFEDGSHLDTTWNSRQDSQDVKWTFDKPARTITLDPNYVLLDWNRRNNRRGVTTWTAETVDTPQPDAPKKIEKANWTTYTVAEGLLINDVRFLNLTAEGQLIAGYQLYSRKPGTSVQYFDGQWIQPDCQSFPSGPIFAATTQPDGTLWTGDHGRIRRIRGDQVTLFTTAQYREPRSFTLGQADLKPNPRANCTIPGCVVYDMTTDHEGRVWLATDNGIALIDSDARILKHMTTDDGLPSNEVLCMTWQDENTLWVGTDRGCASFDQHTWSTHKQCPQGIITCLTTDRQGNVYLGTYRHGVYVYNGKTVHRYHSYNSRLPHNMVTALACDPQNRLWVGTCLGLWCMDSSMDQIYTRENSGLLSNRISDLVMHDRYLWIATDAGIARYDLTPDTIASVSQ
jgi:hypothetical protein